MSKKIGFSSHNKDINDAKHLYLKLPYSWVMQKMKTFTIIVIIHGVQNILIKERLQLKAKVWGYEWNGLLDEEGRW